MAASVQYFDLFDIGVATKMWVNLFILGIIIIIIVALTLKIGSIQISYI